MRTRHFHIKWISVLAILVGLAFATYEGFHWFTHVYEFDARIKSDMTRVSSRVNGTIEDILVKEGDVIKRGDLLVTMKMEQIRERIRALEAELKEAKARKDKLVAERYSLETNLNSKISSKLKVNFPFSASNLISKNSQLFHDIISEPSSEDLSYFFDLNKIKLSLSQNSYIEKSEWFIHRLFNLLIFKKENSIGIS